ncbi:MAG: L-threonylcarbamoyladenylate synthase [Anaerolineae bacterium]
MTLVLKVDPESPEPEFIARAAAVIRGGGLVAFPTETVYGLGANALDGEAVTGIFVAKDRPSYDPLIVHLADANQINMVVAVVPDVVRTLAAAFWPGPLTLVLPRGSRVPLEVTAGGDTVAVRVPSHPVAQALLEAAGVPIAAPSANRFGRVSPTRPEHVLHDLESRFDLLLDAGSTPVGVESTVLSLVEAVPTLLRPGGVSREALERVLGPIEIASSILVSEDQEPTERLISPGTSTKHYAPRAEVILYRGEREPTLFQMRAAAEARLEAGDRVGVLLVEEDMSALTGLPVEAESLGSITSMRQIAQRLFAALRALDQAGVEVILTRDLGDVGLGLAVRDRLMRAAGGRVVEVTTGENCASALGKPTRLA